MLNLALRTINSSITSHIWNTNISRKSALKKSQENTYVLSNALYNVNESIIYVICIVFALK